MSAETTPPAGAFKKWFNADLYHAIADSIAAVASGFDRDRFIGITLDGIADRELMDRLRQTSVAFQASVPGTYLQQLKVLRQIAGPQENGLIGCWYADFIGQFGVEHPRHSLPALAEVTRYGSAEFAIREFLLADPDATLATMRQWSRDANEHVRRLACEGARPRLPWGKRLKAFIENPRPTRQILETLRDDPSRYVRKSVANHLNDISKDHPDYVIALVSTWDRSSPRTAGIVKQGLRTLIKQAHPAALDLMGVGQPAELSNLAFSVSPSPIDLGNEITIRLQMTSASIKPQQLMIDYVVHYVKASGQAQPKVFKWKQIELASREQVVVTKRQIIKDFTTRKHHPGKHRVEIQINGARLAAAAFTLRAKK